MQVLIVEDKRSLAGHLGRALEGEGYALDGASPARVSCLSVLRLRLA